MQKIDKGPLSLTFRMEPTSADKATRSVEAAISNATPVQDMFYGNLVLSHTPDAIDMSRAKDGLVMLFNHDHDNPIGRIENVRLDPDATLRGTFNFSKHESADRYWSQVEDGTLTDISVGAEVLEYEEGDDVTNITRWQPYEASVVSIGRIPSAKIGMSNNQEENLMVDEVKSGEETKPEAKTAAKAIAAKASVNKQQQGTGVELERKRQHSIRELFAKPAYEGEEYQALLNFCLDEGLTIENTQKELLDFIGYAHEGEARSIPAFAPEKQEPQVSFNHGKGKREASVSMGRTSDEAVYDSITAAIEHKVGIKPDIDHNNPFVGFTFSDMARNFAKSCGVSGVDQSPSATVMKAVLDRNTNIRLALGAPDIRAQHSTGDFSGILANVIDKAIRAAYDQTAETWRSVVRVGSVQDFRQANRPAMSAFDDLLVVPEGGEYKHGEQSDLTEYLQAQKWGRIFSITREALLADDLSAFSDQAMRLAMSAARVVGDQVWAVYLNNPTLNQDATPVFDALHSNVGTAGAPSVTTLSEARKLMRTQTDPSGKATLGLSASLLIVPPTWETEALTLISAQNLDYEMNTGDGITQKSAANQFNGLMPVVEHRLGGADGNGTQWFMQANPVNPVPFVEVAFVRGQETPTIESREGFNVDGLEYKVRQEFGVAPLAYQPVVSNAGA